MLGQVVGGLGDPGADDEPEPGVLQVVQVRRRGHPGVSDHDHVSYAMALRERAQHRDQGGGLGLVALEQVHLEREAARVRQEPGLDLRAGTALLAHPNLAQLVLVVALEVQRRHVVEHQGGGAARADRVRPGSRGQLPAVVTGLRAGQGPEQRAQAHGRRADLVQDPHDPGLGGRLHDACQDHRTEPVIAQDVKPQPRIRAGQDRPEQISGRPCDPPARSDGGGTPTGHRLRRPQRQLRFAGPVRDLVHPRRDHRQVPQVQDVLTRGQPLARGCQQQRELGISMRGPHMLDPHGLPAPPRDDLNRDRP
jgi:hypothetical protein